MMDSTMGAVGDRCCACHAVMSPWDVPSFRSECAHAFHLRCASGRAAWIHTPAFLPALPHYQPLRATNYPFVPADVASRFGVCHGGVGNNNGASSTTDLMEVDRQSTCTSTTITAECRHAFHLTCLVPGTWACPVCGACWARSVSSTPSHYFPMPPPAAAVYDDDDEPLEQQQQPPQPMDEGWDLVQRQQGEEERPLLVLDAHCELPAVARGAAHDNFVVMLHAKAPPAAAAGAATEQARAPIDLVAVLDVSGSMAGYKIALLKKAVEFVVDQLGPADRLCARRLIPLTRMTADNGKAAAKAAVNGLNANGGTDILKCLTVAAKVLDGRRHRNPVASVILLSDGCDTYNLGDSYRGYYGVPTKANNTNYRNLLLPSTLSGGNGNGRTPIHTFGFGSDHDALAMHAVAEETGGTFSFIENMAVVQDAFAQCVGGLLSVSAQEVWIAASCTHHGVRVRGVKSGRYASRVEAYGRAASVDVGELYADEERRFLLLVDVPRAGEGEEVTELLKVTCTYRDAATGKVVSLVEKAVSVRRPVVGLTVPEKKELASAEVARERFRVEATEDIAAARAAAERGEHAEAARILDRRQVPAGLAGDARVASRREYEQSGRAVMLAGMSSHAQQRAGSARVFGAMAGAAACSSAGFGLDQVGAAAPAFTFGAAGAYATPAMRKMEDTSRMAREQQQQQTTTAASKSGSFFARNNGGS
ncbi:LOW QUALITY PROTEIN: hypothetical protein BRADI_1g77480v3 [Brachypodium distachyon]|uniref:VWFA domain-containing protein n=1 Tax=Brachypodium distachyon TaxID=15368 RepID=A0A2K2DVM7_BRADI|nr:LOW QUALITY PROTEIN: hypothetical protein BRADI_1g77480v3 [Brachypodium distachyon]